MTPDEQTQLQSRYEAQLAYTESGQAAREGSPAIALGRSAGMAQLLGYTEKAQQLWDKLAALPHAAEPASPALASMPSFAEFYTAYSANKDAFAQSDFANREKFPIPATIFSNAAGSYAFALDHLRRGAQAFAIPGQEPAGDAQATRDWGSKALETAGFKAQAALMQQPTLTVQGAAVQSTLQTPAGPAK